MAVTTSLALEPAIELDLGALTGPTISTVDVVGFADGSFAVAVTRDGDTDSVEVHYFSADGTPGAISILTGSNATISRLIDGRMVVTTESGGDVLFSVLTRPELAPSMLRSVRTTLRCRPSQACPMATSPSPRRTISAFRRQAT